MRGVPKLFGAFLMSGVVSLTWVLTADANTIINLVTSDSGSSNGAQYVWTNIQPTGTGVIDPFLRIQGKGIEQGYNHSLGGTVPWDTKPGIWTHDIQMQDLTVVGSSYQFLLDINEKNNAAGRFLSLNNVQIFTRSTPITSSPNDFTQLGTLRYNNDVGLQGDTTVRLDYSRNHGSGSGDMFMYIPVSFFATTMPADYVYFYSKFGTPDLSDAGFEEWAVLKSTASVPDGGMTISLLGCTLVGLGVLRRKFNR